MSNMSPCQKSEYDNSRCAFEEYDESAYKAQRMKQLEKNEKFMKMFENCMKNYFFK